MLIHGDIFPYLIFNLCSSVKIHLPYFTFELLTIYCALLFVDKRNSSCHSYVCIVLLLYCPNFLVAWSLLSMLVVSDCYNWMDIHRVFIVLSTIWLSLIQWIFLRVSGWAFADSVLHRLAPLWIGARGLEFTWEYIFQGLEANANLVCFINIMLNCEHYNMPYS